MIMEVMVCIPTKEVVFVRMVCAEYSTTTLVVYSIYVMVGTFVMCCVMWDDCSSARRSNSETTGSLELIYRVYKKNRNILEYIYPAKQQKSFHKVTTSTTTTGTGTFYIRYCCHSY